jgi:hypothetical protein
MSIDSNKYYQKTYSLKNLIDTLELFKFINKTNENKIKIIKF